MTQDIDFFQIALKTLLSAGIILFLRNSLNTAIRNPELDEKLKKAWILIFVVSIFIYVFSEKYSDETFYNFFFAFVIYIIYKANNPKVARMLLIAIIPVFIINNFNNISAYYFPNNFIIKSTKEFSDIALFWMFGFGVYSQRASKRERAQAKKDKEDRDKLEAQKNSLEYQVAERTAEITEQKVALENTVATLKATQNQLIHAEKMASLGELTAGIAHEIQNPLNFVNNFSEVSTELATEMKEELATGNMQFVNEIADDLIKNLEKITLHGKRASSIVTGMLMHSRTSTGEKELTDINALADEYLSLSYHGLRAKDKSFNAEIKTDFAPNLPKINIIPQDMGRVLLNLINNAFYAVQQRNLAGLNEGYKPIVTVSTKLISDANSSIGSKRAIFVSISDNGSGMSPETKAKIFQPFFTTKPTGQGTGLGLSLAYDIITKGHGGTIECESVEGVGTEFLVKLPV
jgi:two-component system, NtrC family, sensor kinase